MKTIKVIPINRIGDSAYNDNPNIILFNFFYFHGKLADDIGYDKCEIMNIEDLDIQVHEKYEDISIITIPDGIYDVEVEGIDHPCIGYFWNVYNFQRGLICYKTDFEACKDATDKFNKKTELI